MYFPEMNQRDETKFEGGPQSMEASICRADGETEKQPRNPGVHSKVAEHPLVL